MNVPGNMGQRALAAGLAATLALTAWTWQRQDALVSEPVVPRANPSAPARQMADAVAAHVRPVPEHTSQETVADLFAVTQWEPVPLPPPPPVSHQAPPPAPEVTPPVAPPLPFRYVGRQEPASGPVSATEYYLMRDTEVLAVRTGERIGQDYRFDGDNGNGVLGFVYLPLGTQQSLFIGEEK